MKGKKTIVEIADNDRYKLARRRWDQMVFGGIFVRNSLIVLVLLLTGIVLVALVFAYTSRVQPKYIPYVIEKDSNGQFSFKGEIQPSTMTLTDSMMVYILKNFIFDIRTVSSDPVEIKRNLYNAIYEMTDSGRGVFNQMITSYPMLEMASKKITVDLKFDVFQHVSETSWFVKWNETYSDAGKFLKTVAKQGTFFFVRENPTSPEALQADPFGIYFDNFTIQDQASQ
jgi:type IV secretory pathway TrbF-like protein